MLGTIRKFSSSIYAKIILFIVIMPFIFWGMGDLFKSGNQNTILKIGKDNISTQEFVEYIKINTPVGKELDSNSIENLLSGFIGEKLLSKEIEEFKIELSDISLSSIIKNQKIFKKNNLFSRTEYEKFLVTNGISAVGFENQMFKQGKKQQMLDLISGGIIPSKFLISYNFDKINQKRNIKLIDLNDFYKKKTNITEKQINNFFIENKESFTKIYKSIKFIKLDPENLTNEKEYSDLFFKKIDEIDDLIVEGKNIDHISKKYNLTNVKILIIDELGKDKNSNVINDFSKDLIKKIFILNELEPTALVSHNDEHFIFESVETNNVQKNVSDNSVRKEIILKLKNQVKRKLISELIAKINQNNFNKSDFDKIAKEENISVKQIKIENQNDYKLLKKELVDQIYGHPEKVVIIIADTKLSESYLAFIESIENASINEKSEEFQKYFDLSKNQIVSNLYNTYDSHLKSKYKIDVNYKALESIKNSL